MPSTTLNRLRRKVDGATIDETSRRTLARMVDNELEKQKQYVEINRAKIELDLQNDAIRTGTGDQRRSNRSH